MSDGSAETLGSPQPARLLEMQPRGDGSVVIIVDEAARGADLFATIEHLQPDAGQRTDTLFNLFQVMTDSPVLRGLCFTFDPPEGEDNFLLAALGHTLVLNHPSPEALFADIAARSGDQKALQVMRRLFEECFDNKTLSLETVRVSDLRR